MGSYLNIVEVWRNTYEAGDVIHAEMARKIKSGEIVTSLNETDVKGIKEPETDAPLFTPKSFYTYDFTVCNSEGLEWVTNGYSKYQMFVEDRDAEDVLKHIDEYLGDSVHDNCLLLYSYFNSGDDDEWDFLGILNANRLDEILIDGGAK